ncbi:Chlororespiratory reduction 3, putative isoform 2 [Hibiscus syriacus]|uniref:Chlororespiratory reduction 3, putative isoform 2 n=1 Tax=Hibiscus syriacus TaxID=106335 RepID=A0A6A3A482_HIBSY|nr:Chlororespiratory reduction 3, putative isoform 2 [Hibiscus syriacus]
MTLACLSCSSISTAGAVFLPLASLVDKPSPQETHTNSKPKTASRPRRRRQRLRQQKPNPPPSIVQIERAIGAGFFRDADSGHIFFYPLSFFEVLKSFFL